MVPSAYREAVVAAQRPLLLDPLLGRADAASRDASRLLDRGLLRLDGRVVPAPDLASTWGVTGDGLTYRFELAAGRRWSDGTPLTSHDVAATVALVQRADFPDQGLSAGWKAVLVAIQGDSALTLTLPAARASFAATVADLPILPAATASRPTADLVAHARDPVPSSGPMRVRSSDAGTLLLEANSHASPGPQLASMALVLEPDFTAAARAFAAGQVDAVDATTPAERAAVAALPGARLHDTVSLSFVDLLLNARIPGLADAAVRRALATAVDRSDLIQTALMGAGRAQVDAVPAGILWVGTGTPEQHDTVLANRALDAAGYVRDGVSGVRAKGAVRLAFTLSVPDAAPLPAVATMLARQLGAIGVQATVATVAADRFIPDVVESPGYGMALAEWDNGADPDISAYWRSNATPPAGFNVSGLPADPFLDRALDSLATELDPQLRAEAAQRVDQRLAEEVPAVFLYAPITTFATGDALGALTTPAAGTTAARYESAASWSRAPGH